MVLNQDFREFIQSLNDNKVRYLVIGGYAVAFYGHPRYTKDLDIWLELSEENAARIIKALDQFGFSSLGLTTQDFLEPDTVVRLGYPPNQLDLLIGLEGMNFAACYTARAETEIEGLPITFIDLEGLRKSKRLAGRLQDLADLESLATENRR